MLDLGAAFALQSRLLMKISTKERKFAVLILGL
jgi:hypothetical protein